MRKISILLVVLVALFGVASVTTAQDTPPTFCGDLTQSDCDILTQSAAAMRDLESAGFNFQLDFNIDNIPDYPAGGFGMKLQGNGAYAVDKEALSPLLLSPEALMENIDDLPQIMEDAIRSISADATFLMFFPDSMRAALSEEGTDLPEKAGLSVKMVDGMAYLNLDKLTAVMQSSNMDDVPKGWFGFDLAGYYRQMLDEQASSLTGMDFNMQDFSQFNNMDALKEYVNLERVADATVDGESVAVFKTTLDMNALVTSDMVKDWITQQMETSGSTISKTDLKQLATVLNMLFDDFNFEVTQSIDLDDFYTRQMDFNLDWSVDLNAISREFDSSSGETLEPINIGFHFTAGLDQFNSVTPISAPSDAIIIPLDRLNNMDMIPDLPAT